VQDYLQSLNKKPTKPVLQWDKFGELSDLSADDTDTDRKTEKTTTTKTSGNKFIKKKPEPQSLATSQKPAETSIKASSAGDAAVQSALGSAHARSSALGKAQSFAAKYSASRGATGKVTTLSSDSELELSLSPDEEVLADVRAEKHNSSAGHFAVESGLEMCLHDTDLW